MEHPFTTYVRTKVVFQHRLKDLKNYETVKIYMYELKKMGLKGEDIYRLRERGEIWYDEEGMFRAVQDGPLNPKMMELTKKWKKVKGKLTDLHLYMMRQLLFVSVVETDDLPVYFKAFIDHRGKSLEPFFTVDGFSGRVHTPVVNLKSSKRGLLRFVRNKICSLDVKQMQPLILAKILEDRVGENPFSSSVFGGEDVYLILLKFNTSISTRDEAKKFLFQLIFGQPMDEIGEVFKGDTRWVTWINHYKKRVEEKNPHSRDMHTNLAWLLQTQEVSIMTEVWQELMDLGMKFLTIHDALLVRIKDRERAYGVLDEVLKRHFRMFEIVVENF